MRCRKFRQSISFMLTQLSLTASATGKLFPVLWLCPPCFQKGKCWIGFLQKYWSLIVLCPLSDYSHVTPKSYSLSHLLLLLIHVQSVAANDRQYRVFSFIGRVSFRCTYMLPPYWFHKLLLLCTAGIVWVWQRYPHTQCETNPWRVKLIDVAIVCCFVWLLISMYRMNENVSVTVEGREFN